MSNFGNHLAYPTPDCVAYRRDEEIARAPVERPASRPAALALVMRALRRLARAWVTAHSRNAYL